jgi:hypothetical protein
MEAMGRDGPTIGHWRDSIITPDSKRQAGTARSA